MAVKKSEIYSRIWQGCDVLRGGMDASQYKDYVLSILFIKYVSDKYAGQPYGAIKVPAGASFADMVALKGRTDIGDQINKKIIAPLAAANKLGGFPDFDDSGKLGSGKQKQDTLTNLIAVFEDPALNFARNRAEGDDILGDAYEYLMRHFATESGKSKGQFYTPAEVSRIMAQIIGIQNPRTNNQTTVYDPTCGSGSLLIKVADAAGVRVTLYGQEKDGSTAGLAQMNLILHDYAGAVIHPGQSTLAAPFFRDGEALKTFDYVVANPPFSDKRWSQGMDPNELKPGLAIKEESPDTVNFHRFDGFGVPPPKQGDFAYLLHIIKSLKPAGKGACIMPHGVLFRGNAEAEIRKNLIQRGLIRAIIGLPAELVLRHRHPRLHRPHRQGERRRAARRLHDRRQQGLHEGRAEEPAARDGHPPDRRCFPARGRRAEVRPHGRLRRDREERFQPQPAALHRQPAAGGPARHRRTPEGRHSAAGRRGAGRLLGSMPEPEGRALPPKPAGLSRPRSEA